MVLDYSKIVDEVKLADDENRDLVDGRYQDRIALSICMIQRKEACPFFRGIEVIERRDLLDVRDHIEMRCTDSLRQSSSSTLSSALIAKIVRVDRHTPRRS